MEGIEDSIEKYLKKLPEEALFERLGLNNVLTYIHLSRNKFESARGLALAVQSSTPNQMSRYTLSYSYVSLAMQQVVLGQLRQARHSVGVVKELAASFELNDAVANSIPTPVWAELLYEENKTREAKLLLEQALPLIRSQALSDLLISAYITLARIQALDKEFHLALKTLEDLERIGYLDQQPRIIATARWELVRQYQLQGNLSRAEDIYHSIGAEGLSSRLPQYRFHPADIEADDITLIRLYLGRGELEMPQMITDGHSNKDIGHKLFVAESTVKWHLGNIYSKIGVRTQPGSLPVAGNWG
jgi:ATP/maltotriose-dependent transcriptional regulator MalT